MALSVAGRRTVLSLNSAKSFLFSRIHYVAWQHSSYSSFSYSTIFSNHHDDTDWRSQFLMCQHLGTLLPFCNQWYRGFAKAKKSKSEENLMDFIPDIGPTVKATASTQMEAALDALTRELTKLRTGRATAGMLDHIIIESDGSRTPLSRMAAVSVIDSQTLSVLPYDINAIKEVESAIISSPLGLNPTVDGDRLIVPIPKLTKDHIQAITRLITKASEDVKQSIRRARQKALDTVKKSSTGMSKDDIKRIETEIDKLTKKYIKSAEDICKAKEKELVKS